MKSFKIEDLLAEKARRRLLPFMEQAWHIIEPVTPYKSNWHLGCICEHLEAVTMGQITDILFNVPPGHSKSIASSVMWHPWEWIKHPHYRYLCGSYDDTISLRDNIRARDIITSDWYQRHFPLELKIDQNAKGRYDNVKTGWRIGTSVGGRGTGEHPHRKIIDDPHNVKQSLSDAQRKEALTWFSLTMGSRGVALNSATVVIMQRLHEEDLSGHILATMPHFVHVCLPLRYEPPVWVDLGDGKKELTPRMKTTPIGFQDPRNIPGELLWPSLFDKEKVDKMELQLRSLLGEYGVAGQCQQRPAPEKGGFFEVTKLEIVDAPPSEDMVLVRARGWDGAGTEAGGDFTVGVRLSITHGGTIYIEDVVRDQVGPGQDDLLMRQTGLTDPFDTRHIEEQEGGSAGKKVIHSHGKSAMAGLSYEGASNAGNKRSKARPFASQVNLGNVKLVKAPWNKPYIDELRAFPTGAHDDQVDASAIGYNGVALEVESTITFGTTTSL